MLGKVVGRGGSAFIRSKEFPRQVKQRLEIKGFRAREDVGAIYCLHSAGSG